MKAVKVVCGIIWQEGKVFIARRKPEKSLGGFWEFPGGKIEVAEDAKQALIRELKEELKMNVLVGELFGEHIYPYDTFNIHLIAYECTFVDAEFHLTDHDQYEFVAPQVLSEFRLAPADLYFMEKLNA